MYDLNSDMPIGVFDSGLGGISVLKHCVRYMPHERFIYFGDSKNAPYGTKSLEEVRELSFAVVDRLFKMRVKGILVACNTATSAVIRLLREKYPDFPFVGIEPAVKPAALENPGRTVLVLATPRTLKEEKFQYLKREYDDVAKIIKVPCMGLMEYVEDGKLDGPEVKRYISQVLGDYPLKKVGAIVLGCTHYSFLRDTISAVAGPDIRVYDGAQGTAREMRRRISVAEVLSDREDDAQILFLNSATEETVTVTVDYDENVSCTQPEDIHLRRAVAMLGMKC
ncbi:MAG: glutamate racemase [Lachnospiraceae bacterium]|nr:glutamate racemase [Lachnospiraceae bacterium]